MNMLYKSFLVISFLLMMSVSFVYSNEVTFYTPTYFTQSENEVDPLRFLEYEPLIFEVCPEPNVEGEIQNISAQVMCSTNEEEIDLNRYSSNGCYYGNIEEVSCESGELEIAYVQDSKQYFFSKELLRTKESSVVERILSENIDSIDDPLDLSYYLIVHNKIKGINSISDEVYNKIRDLRDNEEKCWSDNDCSIEETTQILYNLQVAGYDE